MLFKASQRGGATKLAKHLMNVEDNEHVEVHEISGFVANDLHGALKEIYALSRGTQCKQYMFSVSLNPPETEIAPIEYFENAIGKIEERNKLTGQPKVIVFHEKEGRRHAHAVWSRIKVDEMKAINLPYFKTKLQDISRQLFFQYGWKLPEGLLNKENRNPLNFSLAEWQQAKRNQEDPRMLKSIFQEAWATSDSKISLETALTERGFWLAKGDKRGFVAIDYKGEVYSLSRWSGVKTKELKQRLGEPENLPSVHETKVTIGETMTDLLKQYADEVKQEAMKKFVPLKRAVKAMKKEHQWQRNTMRQFHDNRYVKEEEFRQARLPRGIKGLWARVTGQYKTILMENDRAHAHCLRRDREKTQSVIQDQLKERQKLQERLKTVKAEYKETMLALRQDTGQYAKMQKEGADMSPFEVRLSSMMQAKGRKGPGYEPEI